MSYSCFSCELNDHIAHIRFNRPDHFNSFTPAFWEELPRAINTLSDEGEARVIVLSAEGKHFTAGMDIAVFMGSSFDSDDENPQISAEAFRHHVRGLQESFSAIEKARMPVLAAIQGGAVGAGVDLATACDCRYASKEAFLCVQETAIGMTADVGTFPRLAKLIPEGWARQMSYTAERLPAQKAKEIGLVNEVYDSPETMLTEVMKVAATIAGHSPLAVTGCKQMITYSRDHTTADSLDYIGVWNAAMLRPDDIRESYIAKKEKRMANYAPLKPISKFV